MMRPHRRRIVIDGRSFRLIESARPASATAPTVVLVHGIGMSHRYLTRLHEVLAVSTRVVSIDLPGFGGLPKPGEDLDVPGMAKLLGGALATLADDEIVLVGHSMGAQWALEAARQRPELIRSVVAIGPVTDDRHRTLGAQARALGMDTLGESPSINAVVFSDYVRCGVPWYLQQLRHMLAYATEEKVHGLSVPLLVIRGGDDPVAGRGWCRRLRDSAPQARLVEVPGHRHVVQQSAPRTVAAAILFHTVGDWPEGAGPARGRIGHEVAA